MLRTYPVCEQCDTVLNGKTGGIGPNIAIIGEIHVQASINWKPETVSIMPKQQSSDEFPRFDFCNERCLSSYIWEEIEKRRKATEGEDLKPRGAQTGEATSA